MNKAYYHFTHAQPPNKTVVNEMMRRCVEAAELKEMPFIQLVGDQPAYALILELKNENPKKHKNTLPVMGGFHVQGTFMSTINKRFKGLGIFQLSMPQICLKKDLQIRHSEELIIIVAYADT